MGIWAEMNIGMKGLGVVLGYLGSASAVEEGTTQAATS
jgi:hypothetical protein